ncbi:enediyne biosynthesis protein UnbU [Streptosporangium carneum]|uniref:Enediyne biosynthesis protein UnbU n=1 Tax=Streptosporangium carneum TaxID=47481 RepID=A0A9W6I8Q7_9ACTN|nr:enediyne biosynthesis protein UnbU [Streptosporangium carneum]GLK13039.1 hypothetical protein GCM10017600_64500 [Streptosporangium carneum]
MTATPGHATALRRLAATVTGTTVLGHCLLGFEQPFLAPFVGALTGVTAELALETADAWAVGRPPRYLGGRLGRTVDFLLPSYVDGLLCAMLLYGQAHLTPVALAVLIGVGGRYALRVRPSARTGPRAPRASHGSRSGTGGDAPGVPYMNPVALGVAVVPLLFPWVGVVPPHQFTAWVSGPFDVIVPLAVLALGLRAHAGPGGRLPLILGWAGGFVLQGLVRGAPGDVPTIGALLPMTGVLFVLYTCFVLPDLGTTPLAPRHQVVFGLTAAAVYGLLAGSHADFALPLCVVVVCACRGALLAVRGRLRPGDRTGRAGQPMPGPTRSRTRRDPSCLTSRNAPEARTRR